MAWEDSEAIFIAYPTVKRIIHDGEEVGCYDAAGNKISVVQSNIDAARTELDKTKYKTDRVGGTADEKVGTYYADIGDQLDMLYHDIVAGKLNTTGTWATHIKAVKDANPKS